MMTLSRIIASSWTKTFPRSCPTERSTQNTDSMKAFVEDHLAYTVKKEHYSSLKDEAMWEVENFETRFLCKPLNWSFHLCV